MLPFGSMPYTGLRQRFDNCLRFVAGPGLVAMLATFSAPGCGTPEGGRTVPPNVVLVTIDTLRADHLSLYGYARDTATELTALASEGAVFQACYTQSTTTGASHASLFTSRHPRSCGVTSNNEAFPRIPSLMDALGSAGYVRAGFVSSVIVGRRFRIEAEFDHFDDEFTGHELNRDFNLERPAGPTFAAAANWLRKRPADRPFFVWVHLIDPHGPYQPPVDADVYVDDAFYGRDRRELELSGDVPSDDVVPAYQRIGKNRDAAFFVARYDAEIRYVDRALGVFIRELGRTGELASTIVVVTSDHGETLAERGHRRIFSHGATTYEELSRVPLVMLGARGGLDPRRLDTAARVRLIDIAPTLLRMTGVPQPVGFEGRDLFAERQTAEDPIYTFSAYGPTHPEASLGTQFSVLAGGYRYIANSPDDREELYRVHADPSGQRDVSAAEAEVREELRGQLRRFLAATPEAAAEAIPNSPEWVEQLRSLGYLAPR